MSRPAKRSTKVLKQKRHRPVRPARVKPGSATGGITPAQLLREPDLARSLNPAQRRAALAAQQGVLGNRATAALVQQQTATTGAKQATATAGAAKTGGDGAGPMLPAYKMVVKGKTYYMTPGQYRAVRKRTIGRLRYFIQLLSLRSKSGKEVHEWWMQKQRGWMGFIADAFAGIAAPSADMWEVPHEYLIEAEREVDDGNLDRAASLIAIAQQKYNQVREIWDRYQEKTRGGARAAIKALEITRDVSFAVAGAIGGVVAAPAGAGLLATAGISALIGGGLRFVREAATRFAELWHNVRSSWDIAGFLQNVGTSAIASFGGALVSGPLSDLFFKRILGGIGDDIVNELASELKMTASAVRRLYGGRLKSFLVRFLSGATGSGGSALVQAGIKGAIEKAEGKKVTAVKFADMSAEEFLRRTGPSKITTFLLKFGPRGTSI